MMRYAKQGNDLKGIYPFLLLNVESMIDSGSYIVFRLQEHAKQSKPGYKGMVD